MFEIGTSLREARLRQQLEFAQVEQATKIRGKYLRALEDEQFETLPSQTYIKGFLRSYADYLGLDGQLYVDEYNSRYVVGEEETPLRPSRPSPRARAHRRIESNVVLAALVAIGLVTALVIAAWKFGGAPQKAAIPNLGHAPAATVHARTAETKPARRVTTRKTVAKPVAAHLVLAAVGGSCWVSVHEGSATGPRLFEGTLAPGQVPQRFVERRIWLRVGAPSALSVKLNGKTVPLRASSTPVSLVLTKNGVTAA